MSRMWCIAGGDCVYKLDYGKVLEYHIEKKADITVVCKEMPPEEDVTRFGLVKLNDDGRITDFEEKPMLATSSMISCGIYVIRRRQLIELLERCAAEDRYDFVTDILVRYKNLKRIYAYKLGYLLEQYRFRGFLLQDEYGFPKAGSKALLLQGVSGDLFQGR